MTRPIAISRIKFAILVLSFFSASRVFSEDAAKAPVGNFKFCGLPYQLEIAKTNQLRTQGLMYRDEVAPGKGMLFIFKKPEALSFWMKNVKIPLDIAFLDAQGKVVKSYLMASESLMIRDNKRTFYSSVKPAQFALEFAAGTISKMPKADLQKCRLQPLPKIDDSVEESSKF